MSYLCGRINDIIKCIQAGDKDKMEDLVYVSFNHLKRVAMRYVYDKSECEDVVMDAYARVMMYIHSADLEKDGYNWLCKIVQNVAIAYNKRRRDEPLDEATCMFSTDDFDDDEDEKLLNKALDSLPYDERVLIYIKYVEKVPYRKMSSRLCLSKSALQKRVMKSLKNLTKFFDN